MRGQNEFKPLSFHRVDGLKRAKGPVDRPSFIPKGRPRGAKRLGVRYELEVKKALPVAFYGQWFEFEDSSGQHHCQPDFWFMDGVRVFVVECKLSDTPEARRQLRELYLPVVGMALRRETFGIVITKRLTSATQRSHVKTSIREAVSSATPTFIPVVHWLGVGPLLG